jgi:hypothetical protein
MIATARTIGSSGSLRGSFLIEPPSFSHREILIDIKSAIDPASIPSNLRYWSL